MRPKWLEELEMVRRKGLFVLLLLMLGSCLPSLAQPIGSVYRKVNASVVVIKTKQKEMQPQINQFVSVGGLGSGVLISKDGKVLTAAHVIQVADEISVEFPGGEKVGATVLGSVPQMDIALLQLERVPKGAEIAPLGDSDTIQVGDRVFIIGAPFGITHTLTVGHISARREPTASDSGVFGAEFLQTDAAINPGNSGGPMFNMAGEVVGIVSHIISQSGGFEGLGFAVSSNTARYMLLNRRPLWSGLDGYFLGDDMAALLNLPTRGILVQRVADGSVSEQIGLQPGLVQATIGGETLLLGGDVIVEALGVALSEDKAMEKIRDKMERLASGGELTLMIIRKGKLMPLTMLLASR